MRLDKQPASGIILPDALYRRSAALSALGLGGATIRRARRAGIELATLQVGQQLLARGRDVIDFVERLAAADAERVRVRDPTTTHSR